MPGFVSILSLFQLSGPEGVQGLLNRPGLGEVYINPSGLKGRKGLRTHMSGYDRLGPGLSYILGGLDPGTLHGLQVLLVGYVFMLPTLIIVDDKSSRPAKAGVDCRAQVFSLTADGYFHFSLL